MRTGLDKNAGLVGLLLDPYVWILDVHPFSSLEARGACTVPARATSGWRGPAWECETHGGVLAQTGCADADAKCRRAGETECRRARNEVQP